MCGRDPENPDSSRLEEGEWLEIAKALDRSGVASLHLSTNYAENPVRDRDALVKLATLIKREVTTPLSLAGNIHDPMTGARLLEEGIADYIELGRPMLADPDYPLKLSQDRERDIRTCVNCNLCRHETSQKRPIRCTVNPDLGRESTHLCKRNRRTKAKTSPS